MTEEMDIVSKLPENTHIRDGDKQCSVIRWTRYDGTDETLPSYAKTVLVELHKRNMIYPPSSMLVGGKWVINWTTPVSLTPLFEYIDPEIGDLWAYITTPDRM